VDIKGNYEDMLRNKIASNSIKNIPDKEIANSERGVFLFVSLDLENGTQFKTSNASNWSKIYLDFFEESKKCFDPSVYIEERSDDSESINMTFWKINGDEILFFSQVLSMEGLEAFPAKVYRLKNNLYKIMCERYNEAKELNIRATIFMAEAGTKGIGNDTKNMIYIDRNTNSMIDFLGPDIDAGFRLSKHSKQRLITVDAKTAYLIYKKCKRYAVPNLKIVKLEKLEGVWKGRLYPIIWYHETEKIEDMFPYDDDERKNKFRPIKDIERLIEEVGYKEEYDRLENLIERAKRSKYLKFMEDLPLVMQVHISAIIYKIEYDTLKIFMGKRSDEKDLLAGYWEFGCVKCYPNKNIRRGAERRYGEIFEKEIDIIVEEECNDIYDENCTIKIMGNYEVVREKRFSKGLFCVAKWCNDKKPLKSDSFTELGWYTLDELIENLKDNKRKDSEKKKHKCIDEEAGTTEDLSIPKDYERLMDPDFTKLYKMVLLKALRVIKEREKDNWTDERYERACKQLEEFDYY